MLIKIPCSIAFSLLLAAAAPATADGFHQVNGSAVLGGAIGGGAGAAVGSAIGGRSGAIVGSAVGAAAGVAIANPREPRVVVHEYHHDEKWHRHAKHHHKHHRHQRHHHDD